MPFPVIEYEWVWNLRSSPAELWPLVANTNRFDRDTGVPPLERLEPGKRLPNARLQFRQRVFGLPLDYLQEPYEWVFPSSYGVVRHYKRGPLSELIVKVTFDPDGAGGTRCTYQVGARARNILGHLAIPIQIGQIFARRFEAGFRSYDRLLFSARSLTSQPVRAEFAPAGRERLERLRQRLLRDGNDPSLVNQLVREIETGDSLALSRMRPYELADAIGEDRRAVLELFLVATRVGLLEFQWDLLCPLCRNARATSASLNELNPNVHCDTCNIDFTANFERSVELTFSPNPAIRPVDRNSYCIGGPVDTPHVVAQQLLAAGESRADIPNLEFGRHRMRVLEQPGGQYLRVEREGDGTPVTFAACTEGWPGDEPVLAAQQEILMDNQTDREQIFILERMAWTDKAVTAAEVITLQRFRDLFATEALRPGERISVGSLAILFTDLRESTRLYTEVGDAPAFGIVMDHFDILRDAVVAQDGSLVKTIGDSIMAVFPRPAAAISAIVNAQALLSQKLDAPLPLRLKAGVHYGPCIAVTLNDRLDYFGSTVNLASRLEGLSSGQDVVISDTVYNDPEVVTLLGNPIHHLSVERIETRLRGFGDQRFGLFKVFLDRVSEGSPDPV